MYGFGSCGPGSFLLLLFPESLVREKLFFLPSTAGLFFPSSGVYKLYFLIVLFLLCILLCCTSSFSRCGRTLSTLSQRWKTGSKVEEKAGSGGGNSRFALHSSHSLLVNNFTFHRSLFFSTNHSQRDHLYPHIQHIYICSFTCSSTSCSLSHSWHVLEPLLLPGFGL